MPHRDTMWLINVDTFVLEHFTNVEPGTYAILSHTWEEDEVTFDDIQDIELASSKKGFAKIRHTCELAAGLNLQWAWVDT